MYGPAGLRGLDGRQRDFNRRRTILSSHPGHRYSGVQDIVEMFDLSRIWVFQYRVAMDADSASIRRRKRELESRGNKSFALRRGASAAAALKVD